MMLTIIEIFMVFAVGTAFGGLVTVYYAANDAALEADEEHIKELEHRT